FFFSSRRRHTRLQGDWSSDVCSSDLPDVFMVHGTPALIPLRKLTNTIPIVFTAVSDPTSQGFVTSISRPGGNLTGFSNFDTDIRSEERRVGKECRCKWSMCQ